MTPPTSCTPTTSIDPQARAFDLWAEVYDTEPNPLLLLESRCATAILPAVRGRDVLDIGCGTGRWLQRLEALSPSSLLGTDPSPAMLRHAAEKLASTTQLVLADGPTFPCPDISRDLILASFVLSYIPDLSTFVSECDRTLRPGGHVVLSDLHPLTSASRGWTRSFTVRGVSVHLDTHPISIGDLIAAFEHHGFLLELLDEPPFGPPELPSFKQAGKLAEFRSLIGVPAIYLARFRKPRLTPRPRRPQHTATLRLTNAPWSSPRATWNTEPVSIRNGLVATPEHLPESPSVDLSGYVLLPGLINAHDHLEFALFPNFGRTPAQPAYRNSAEWAIEIHREHAAVIETHRQIPLETRLWWGAIRNLLSGVTTVCHHNPPHPELSHPDFPVRLVSGFGWSHSLTFDRNLEQRFRATLPGQPFILHAAEGTDPESRADLRELDRLQILDHRTVLVHGLALTSEDISLVNQRGASLVLCPTSNRFLFRTTLPNNLITHIARCALASDSPLTAAGDLLDEIRYLHSEQGLDPNLLLRLVTTGPAAILHLHPGAGLITPDTPADLIAVPNRHATPAHTLARLSFADVELVLRSGRVSVASPSIYARLPHHLRNGLSLLEVAGHQRWVRAPLPSLVESAERILGKGNLRLGGKEVRLGSAL